MGTQLVQCHLHLTPTKSMPGCIPLQCHLQGLFSEGHERVVVSLGPCPLLCVMQPLPVSSGKRPREIHAASQVLTSGTPAHAHLVGRGSQGGRLALRRQGGPERLT